MEESKSTPFKNYVFFGMPRVSTSVVLTVVDFCILFLYFEGYGLSSLFVGLAAMAGKFAIAVSQSYLGWLSDKTKTKYGKRKPYMIIGAPILSISFIFLLLPTIFLGPNPEDMTMFIWLLIWDVMFQFWYGITTPYQSWMAEQFEVHERPQASAFQNIFNYLGTGIAMLFTLLILPDVLASFRKTRVINPIFILILLLFAAMVISLFYISAFTLPVETDPPVRMNLKEDLRDIFKDHNFIHVCMMIGIASLCWSMITGVMLGYINVVLKLENLMIAAGGLAIGVVGSLFVWKMVIDKLGKKKALMIIFVWAICALPFAAILPLMPFDDFTAPALILVLILSSGLGGWFLFPYILYSDLAENNEKTTEEGELKSGFYNGFPSILLNIFQAFGWLLIGILLTKGFLPNTPAGYSYGYLLWAPLGSIILIVALIYTIIFITLDFEWEKEVKK